MADYLKTANDVFKTTTKSVNDINSTLRAGERAYKSSSRLIGADGKPAPKQTANTPAPSGATASQTPQNASVLDSPVQISGNKKYFSVPAPIGTRIIIPQAISSTGQERYLGAHALESIMNMMQGNEKCGNIVILDASNKPSQKYYDIGPEGEIFLKGTNKEVKIYDATASTPSVPLSEKEYEVLKKALSTKTNDVTHFKTTQDRGNAEDSTAEQGSWFSRNWWKILLGLVVAAGVAWGGIALYNNHKEKKEEKAAQTQQKTNSNENTNSNTNSGNALTGTNITNAQEDIIKANSYSNSL